MSDSEVPVRERPRGHQADPGGAVGVRRGDDDVVEGDAEFPLDPLADRRHVAGLDQIGRQQSHLVRPVVEDERPEVDRVVHAGERPAQRIEIGQVLGRDVDFGDTDPQIP